MWEITLIANKHDYLYLFDMIDRLKNKYSDIVTAITCDTDLYCSVAINNANIDKIFVQNLVLETIIKIYKFEFFSDRLNILTNDKSINAFIMSTLIYMDLADEIEYIKTFDPNTQMSISKTDNINIYPINELLYEYNDNIVNDLLKDVNDNGIDESLFENDIESIKAYINNDILYKYINYIYKDTYNLIDYIPTASIFIEEYNNIKDSYTHTIEELNYFLETKEEYQKLNLRFFDDLHILTQNNLNKIYLSNFSQSMNDIKLNNIMSIEGIDIINYHNNIKGLCEDVTTTNKTVLITCSKDISINIIKETFIVQDKEIITIDDILDIKNNKINICKSDNAISFGFLNGLEVITEENIFKKIKLKNSKYRSVYQNTTPLNSKEDLKPGDYIVHYDYGIGQYK